jgi:TetR/AcrR family transcriptional regulator, cholesterol catabolism regulator
MDPLLVRAQEILDEDVAPRAQLAALVEAWVAHVVAHRDHMLVFQQERHVIDHGDQWRGVRDARKRFERLVEQLLVELHGRGETRLDDPRLSLSALLGMVNHTAQWYRPRGRLTAREIADGYVRAILR